MSTQGVVVMGYGTNVLYWLNHSELMNDGSVVGFFHSETDIDYSNNFQTHKSMNIAYSYDFGQTWTQPQLVITSPQGAIIGEPTGEGDCTFIDGKDEYFYAYCLRVSDGQTIVARALQSNPNVWFKYYNGSFSEPGLGGRSTGIGGIGTNISYHNETYYLVASDGHNFILYSSKDRINFKFAQMLFNDEAISIYPSLIDNINGDNLIVDNNAYLVYTTYSSTGAFLVYREVHLND